MWVGIVNSIGKTGRFIQTFGGTQISGRPRTTWEDNIKMNI
jgi:hypothetical protein